MNWKQISVVLAMSFVLCDAVGAEEKTTVAEKSVTTKEKTQTAAKTSPKAEVKKATTEKAGEKFEGKEAPKKEALKKESPKKVKPQIIELADGQLLLPVPGEWKVVKPRNRIIKHEFSIAPVEDGKAAGRMTIMSAGGGVEANLSRWAGQFRTDQGKALGDEDQKVEAKKIGKLTVHVIDLTGTFQDSPRGPFGPKISRPGYRMLGLIVPTKKHGTWFVKFYGPEATIKSAEEAFTTMVAGIKLKS